MNALGVATLTLTTLSVGSHPITAVYTGDANYITSTSTPVTEAIALATTTLTLVGPTAAVDAGTAASFTLTLASNGVAPTGAVTLRDGSNVIGTQAVTGAGTLTFTNSTLAVGTHTLTAVYAGDVNNATGTSNNISVTVQLAATTTTLQTNKSPQTLSLAVTLTATVGSGSPNPGGTVVFQDGGTTIGSATVSASGTATLTTTSLAFGPHTITAVYQGDANHATSISASLSEAIVQASNLTLASSLNPATAGKDGDVPGSGGWREWAGADWVGDVPGRHSGAGHGGARWHRVGRLPDVGAGGWRA